MLKKAGQRKFFRKAHAQNRRSRFSGKQKKLQAIVSKHAKQRFRERGERTIPVYKKSSEGSTVVATYLPEGAKRAGRRDAHGVIRQQIDRTKKCAGKLRKYETPRLPIQDAIIWKASKKRAREQVKTRRLQRHKRMRAIEWEEEGP